MDLLDPVLLLERSRHANRRLAAQQEPHNVEEIDMILGVPKLVWVILLDLVALGCFVALFQQVTRVAKKKPEDEHKHYADVSEDYPGANYQYYADDDPNLSPNQSRSAFTASQHDPGQDWSPRQSEASPRTQRPFFSGFVSQGDRQSISGFSGHGDPHSDPSPRTRQSFFSGFSGHG